MTEQPDPIYESQLRSLLRMSADDLERAGADWEATAQNSSLHAPPAMAVHAGITARAHRQAAALIRAALADLDAPKVTVYGLPLAPLQHWYSQDEILYVLVRNDAETYLEGKLSDDEAPTDALTDEFAELVKHVIDADPGWGERLDACCGVAWERLVEAHPELAEQPEPEAPTAEQALRALKAGTAVVATAHSDDQRVDVVFDAADWFNHASDDEIVDLADNDWGHCGTADDVAQHFEETTTKPLFDYLAVAGTDANGDAIGFECDVDRDQALAWIARYLLPTRPTLTARLAEWYDDGSSAGPGKETP